MFSWMGGSRKRTANRKSKERAPPHSRRRKIGSGHSNDIQNLTIISRLRGLNHKIDNEGSQTKTEANKRQKFKSQAISWPSKRRQGDRLGSRILQNKIPPVLKPGREKDTKKAEKADKVSEKKSLLDMQMASFIRENGQTELFSDSEKDLYVERIGSSLDIGRPLEIDKLRESISKQAFPSYVSSKTIYFREPDLEFAFSTNNRSKLNSSGLDSDLSCQDKFQVCGNFSDPEEFIFQRSMSKSPRDLYRISANDYDWYDSDHHKFLSEGIRFSKEVEPMQHDTLCLRDLNPDCRAKTSIGRSLPFRRSVRIQSVNPPSCYDEAPPKLEDSSGVQPANFQIGQPVVRPVIERLQVEDLRSRTVENEASQESRHNECHIPNTLEASKGGLKGPISDNDYISNSKSGICIENESPLAQESSRSIEVVKESETIQETEKAIQPDNNGRTGCPSGQGKSQSADRGKDGEDSFRDSQQSTSSEDFSLALESE